uniref:Uncharacterized protein n=1 Tax=Anopheles atroparvus TaxID=41427 RepID=A0AAG5CSF7_ANOAO
MKNANPSLGKTSLQEGQEGGPGIAVVAISASPCVSRMHRKAANVCGESIVSEFTL